MGLDYTEIEPQMRGAWHGFIAQETGIEPNTEGREKGRGHECPICGGKDRAHFKEKDGRVFLFCRGACGNTNSTWGNNTCATPEYLCMTVGGYDFPELVNRCGDWLGIQREGKPLRRSVLRPATPPKSNLTPIPEQPVERENLNQPPSQHLERRRNHVDAILSVSELKQWHRIGYCARNSLSGTEGEFMAVNDDLLVPLFLTASNRVVMTGVVQIRADGAVAKHGSCDGAFATIECGQVRYGCDSDVRLFATDYEAAWRLSKQLRCKAYYSPSPNAFKKTDATHVYVNANDCDALDRASAIYLQGVTYILPRGELSKNHVIESFDFMSYDDIQALVKESELA